MGQFADVIIFSLLFIGSLTLVLRFFMRRGFKGRYKARDAYLEADRKSNEVRPGDIEPEFFFTPDMTVLPVVDNAPSKQQQFALACAQNKMIRFPTKRSNIEIKNAYGLANLERIAAGEDNYTKYIGALIDWAETLLPAPEGTALLHETIRMGSDYRKSYLLLANHYAEAKHFDQVRAVYAAAEAGPLLDGIKKAVLSHIAALLPSDATATDPTAK